MTPLALKRCLGKLKEHPPHTLALHRALIVKPVWYTSQREHWLRWLAEYDGPGAYHRKNHNRDAQFIYNHCCCPPMVLWLGEATGVDEDLVKKAATLAKCSPTNFATSCARIRGVIPWSHILSSIQRPS